MAFRRVPATILILVLASAIGGCSSKKDHAAPTANQTTGGGGIDSSGGNVGFSTPDQVRKSIALAIELGGESNPDLNVIARFAGEWMGELDSNATDGSKPDPVPDIHLINKIFPALTAFMPVDADDTKWKPNFSSPVIESLGKIGSRLRLLDKGDCPSFDHKHAEASVSKLSPDAELCFSIDLLTHTPSDVLDQQVMGLLVHEAAHMGGADETGAVRLQNQFKKYFAARFGNGIQAAKLKEFDTQLTVTKEFMGMASHENDWKNPERAFDYFGRSEQTLLSLPYFVDPLAARLTFHPKRPELFSNYSNLVIAVYQEIEAFLNNDKRVSNHREFDEQLRLNQVYFGLIDSDFQAYVSGEGQSYCVLPPELTKFNNGYFPASQLNIVLPPHGCSPGTSEQRFSDIIKDLEKQEEAELSPKCHTPCSGR